MAWSAQSSNAVDLPGSVCSGEPKPGLFRVPGCAAKTPSPTVRTGEPETACVVMAMWMAIHLSC